MSLRLMKERMKISGVTPRDEMIRDGQNLLKEELEHDVSYSPTMYFYDSVNEKDDRLAKLRIQNRRNSTLNGNYIDFLTTYDNPVKVGDYIHDTKDDTYWLVYNSFNVDDIHYEGKLYQCNYRLKWQLYNGKIVSRWCNFASASKYNVGENMTSALILSSNTYTVLIGYCEEAFDLEGKRVFIDIKEDNPTKVFKITRNDDIPYNYGNMGALLSFIADKTEFNEDTDNQQLRICDYFEINNSDIYDCEQENISQNIEQQIDTDNIVKTSVLSAKISGTNKLKVTIPRTYIATILDENRNELEWDDEKYKWNIISDFDIKYTIKNNKIILEIDNDNYVNKSFILQLINGSDVLKEIKVGIIDVA